MFGSLGVWECESVESVRVINTFELIGEKLSDEYRCVKG